MINNENKLLEKVGFTLVLLMALLQGFYAVFASLQPSTFAIVRGTELVVSGDMDWVKIYASRTLFVALIVAYLLYLRNYKILLWAVLFAVVMPITDGLLAYQAHAPLKVILKHIATIIYLLATSAVLQMLVRKQHRN